MEVSTAGKNNNYQFIKVPKGVLSLEELSPTSKLLMGVLVSYSTSQSFANPGNKHLSRLLNCTESTISKSIAELKRQKLIKILHPKSNKRKLYVDHNMLEHLDAIHRSKRKQRDADFPDLSEFKETVDDILSQIYEVKNLALDELLVAISRRAKALDPYLQGVLAEKGVEAYLLAILEAVFEEEDLTVIQHKNGLQFHKNNRRYQIFLLEFYEDIQSVLES